MKFTTFNLKTFLMMPALLLLVFASMTSCSSTVDPYKEELSSELYFQKAHEASDNGNFPLAIDYYKAFQQKFPDEIKGNLWASFEIAFIYHKQGNNDEAIKLFQALLDKYALPGAADYPQAPKILTEKVLADIQNKMKNAAVPTPAPTSTPVPVKTP
jgi:outer membrane protein assembly factor BamD (BamD/ComL family)